MYTRSHNILMNKMAAKGLLMRWNRSPMCAIMLFINDAISAAEVNYSRIVREDNPVGLTL
jgi:hypothetical protein